MNITPYHKKIHICLVSAQTLPNILPALLIKSEFPMEKAYLLTSSSMEEKSEMLKKMLQKLKVRVEIKKIESLSFIDLKEYMYDFFTNLLKTVKREDITCNLTGGTKPMSFAAYEACKKLGIASFYSENEKITSFASEEGETEVKEYNVGSVLTVVNTLNAYGYTRESVQGKYGNHQEVIDYLLNLPNPQLISDFNRYLSGNSTISFHSGLKQLVRKYQEAGLVRIEGKEKNFEFVNNDASKFCRGEWLEEYVLNVLKALKQENYISNYEGAMRIFVDSPQEDISVRNEFDGFFIWNNTLHTLECKTSLTHDQFNKAIFKLDALHKRIGGVYAKGIFVSYSPLDSSYENLKQRAKQSGLIVIEGQQQVKDLKNELIKLCKPRY